jgi:hypothetical protein
MKDLGPALHSKSFIIYDLHHKHQHLNLQYHSFDQASSPRTSNHNANNALFEIYAPPEPEPTMTEPFPESVLLPLSLSQP